VILSSALTGMRALKHERGRAHHDFGNTIVSDTNAREEQSVLQLRAVSATPMGVAAEKVSNALFQQLPRERPDRRPPSARQAGRDDLDDSARVPGGPEQTWPLVDRSTALRVRENRRELPFREVRARQVEEAGRRIRLDLDDDEAAANASGVQVSGRGLQGERGAHLGRQAQLEGEAGRRECSAKLVQAFASPLRGRGKPLGVVGRTDRRLDSGGDEAPGQADRTCGVGRAVVETVEEVAMGVDHPQDVRAPVCGLEAAA
jgi:hypothetical protein